MANNQEAWEFTPEGISLVEAIVAHSTAGVVLVISIIISVFLLRMMH